MRSNAFNASIKILKVLLFYSIACLLIADLKCEHRFIDSNSLFAGIFLVFLDLL